MTTIIDNDVLKLGVESFDTTLAIHSISDFFSVTDSGLTVTPHSGVIYHRRGLGSEQIVYQYAPEIRLAKYGQREKDPDAKVFELAFPWMIAIIAYENDLFKGIRHYFSPDPIYSLDQPLYNVNLPNTNTRGYENTTIGWVCLYLHDVADHTSSILTERLQYALGRHDSMGEPYNYRNMSQTDGFTLYQAKYPDNREWWDPQAWQDYVKEHGPEFILNRDMMIPCMVDWDTCRRAEMNSDAKTAVPYTLRDALYKPHYVYYQIGGAVLLNEWAEIQDNETAAKFVKNHLRRAIVRSDVPKTTWIDFIKEFNPPKSWRDVLRTYVSPSCVNCGRTTKMTEHPQPNAVCFAPSAHSSGGIYQLLQEDVDINDLLMPTWICNRCTSVKSNLITVAQANDAASRHGYDFLVPDAMIYTGDLDHPWRFEWSETLDENEVDYNYTNQLIFPPAVIKPFIYDAYPRLKMGSEFAISDWTGDMYHVYSVPSPASWKCSSGCGAVGDLPESSVKYANVYNGDGIITGCIFCRPYRYDFLIDQFLDPDHIKTYLIGKVPIKMSSHARAELERGGVNPEILDSLGLLITYRPLSTIKGMRKFVRSQGLCQCKEYLSATAGDPTKWVNWETGRGTACSRPSCKKAVQAKMDETVKPTKATVNLTESMF